MIILQKVMYVDFQIGGDIVTYLLSHIEEPLTTLISDMRSSEQIDNEILNLAPGEGINPVSIINDKNCEELAHPHLFPTENLDTKLCEKFH